jgi:hypothetical protein
MRGLWRCRIITMLVLGFGLPSSSQLLHAQTYTVLYAFTNGEAGANPWAGVSIHQAGNLYGTTHNGSGYGTVYKLKKEGLGWILDILLDF